MRCDVCGASDKVFFIKGDGMGGELRLCRACAKARGYAVEGDGGDIGARIGARVESLFQDIGEADPGARSSSPRCPECGRSLDEIRSSGLIGCPACAVAFKREIVSLRKRSGRFGPYEGKTPRAAPPSAPRTTLAPAASLEEELAAALDSEDFERAASLRDLIRSRDASREQDEGRRP